MFATPAFAQATNALGSSGMSGQLLQTMLFIGPVAIMFYFLLIRPQAQRQKKHQAMITAVKRGDTVVLSSGMIGKVVRVEDTELGLEIAQGITVKVVKTMIADVRIKSQPAPANDKA